MKKLIYFLMVWLISQNILAQKTWTGTTNTDWNTASNWSPSGVPTLGDIIVINNATNDPVISSGTTANGLQITINTSGSLTVNSGGSLNILNSSFASNITLITLNQSATLTNNGTLNVSSFRPNMTGISLNSSSATFSNSGTANFNVTATSIAFTNSSTSVTNTSSGIINLYVGNGIQMTGSNTNQTVNNQGTINYSGSNYAFSGISGSGNSFTNSGTFNITNGLGISNGGMTIANNACSKIIMQVGTYDNTAVGSVTTNNGSIQISYNLINSRTFTNSGVLRYGTITGIVSNTGNGSVIVNSTTPIFTYGGTFNGTVNGIYTNSTATTSAGTFTAPNTFTPSSLPNGAQTLYAKITPSGGACNYVVPFTYVNGCTSVATSTETMTWNGLVSSDWNNPCNWTPVGVPTATNPVEIVNSTVYNPVLTSGMNVTISSLKIVRDLTVNSGASLTINNNITSGTRSLFGPFFNSVRTITNNGTITVLGTGRAVSLVQSIDGFDSFPNIPYFTFNNQVCGRLLVPNGDFTCEMIFNNNGYVQTNLLEINKTCNYIQSGGYTACSYGEFTNNGILKYSSYSLLGNGVFTNNTNTSVIVKNTPDPIFTYGGIFNGTVNGIFTNAAATTSAGTFTAPNTFTPNGTLPFGSQTLYAKITPNGEACSHVVPFTYLNGCSQVATSTEIMNWNGSVSTDWNNPCNWTPNGVPTATNPVRIVGAGLNVVIGGTTTAYAKTLTMSGNIGSATNLTNNGTLLLGANETSVATSLLQQYATITNNGLIALETSAGGTVNAEFAMNFDACTLNNNGTFRINSSRSGFVGDIGGDGSIGGTATINNAACAKFIVLAGTFVMNTSSTFNNSGLFRTNGNLNLITPFNNQAGGVLFVGGTVGLNAVINSSSGAVRVNNNPSNTSIFTYQGTFTGTVNGIFTNEAATTSAGTFTAPNTFTPSGLPAGSQTLYAKITPSGGACEYIVPFTYNNVVAPDYTISTTANVITITDVAGNGETINVSESGGNIRFSNANTARTYSIDGGTTTAFTTPADIALSGKTGIVVNTATGDDIVNIGAFSTALPSMTVNGGTGNDNINFNGNISFTANNNLNLDLQNDDASPGTDAISLAANTNIILAGTGTATLKMSKNLTVNVGAVLRTVNGALLVEANQQTTPTTGDFTGVNVLGGTIEATGTGNVTIKGKGGNASDAQRGINLSNGGKIFGGTSGTLTVDGRTQTTTGTNQNGVRVDGLTTKISSYGAVVIVNAKRN